jgi:hypothetical protein
VLHQVCPAGWLTLPHTRTGHPQLHACLLVTLSLALHMTLPSSITMICRLNGCTYAAKLVHVQGICTLQHTNMPMRSHPFPRPCSHPPIPPPHTHAVAVPVTLGV